MPATTRPLLPTPPCAEVRRPVVPSPLAPASGLFRGWGPTL